MLETHIRPKLQPFFDYLGTHISPHASPNTITIIALILGISAAVSIATGYMIASIILISLSGLCDILDGTVARLTSTSNPRGAYMDLIIDRMVEAAIILGFMVRYPQFYVAYITFLIAVLLHFSTFIAAGALFTNTGNKSMHYDRSIVERAEAFVVFILMLLFPHYMFETLLCFNGIVFLAGISRFIRVMQLTQNS